ncbi:putative serine threonine protein kinase [Diaporthe ampelina]|uniref:Putative serine threonine protein kinase n=1 Tax=Diaporthe ampelina TaxID=1214573 RepID=A0A0G2FV90_9PEZI|nr:putative serine threonine protein kinase [Diaporthe ampelina]
MQNAAPFTPLNHRVNIGSTNIWSPGTPRTSSQVARVRYRQNEYFKLWRSGRKNEWQGPQWNIALQDLPPRRSGRWDGRVSMQSAGVERRRDAGRNSIRYYPSGSGSALPTNVQAPARGASLVKILGYGGQGIAALLEVTDKSGASVRKAVMKMSLQDDDWVDDDLRTEKRWQASLMRAMHVVQLVKWSTLRGPPLTLEDVLVGDNPRLYFMELMKHGDLHKVIGRAGNTGQKQPSRLLWKVFACLFIGDFDNEGHNYVPRFKVRHS